ncbi:metallophosphoesterase [Natranaeroarchaeum sulfidigenes]|uniref:Putative phosphohydrolase, MPP superfamily n=1 Tax=Natranaeroarchaeum sulfidigenes TaxID=2784880 RepID=A0A897MUL8_9EURY|nr:metallophosphoesterase [Natranaeroarchaeum sulfidigenes]QSG01935.1 putative phosphohydrolase, MPP superfamily [Natranaeroarchaeum sulfidigenes]
MATVEPLPGEPAAVADIDGEPALVLADVHAGIESALRAERGLSLDSRAETRRDRIERLLVGTDATRLIVLGDLMHSIGGPGGAERGEIEVLLESLPAVDVTLVKGNHDGEIESWIEGVTVTEGGGVRLGAVGFAHGHTWPDPDVLAADIVCVAHEHPQVRLEDEVGGSRAERVWLRGELNRGVFEDRYDAPVAASELIVVPAFNDLVGGTWVNTNDEFLAPFLPDALVDGQAYLLDGTRLGSFREI